MDYAQNGSLRQHLNNNFNSLKWNEKLCNLYYIAHGLNESTMIFIAAIY